jgi:hypothetical protein
MMNAESTSLASKSAGVTEFVAIQHRWRRVVAVGSCQRPQMAAISAQQDSHPADIGLNLRRELP